MIPIVPGWLLAAASALSSAGADPAGAERLLIDAGLHHLRAAGPREWSDFPESAEGSGLTLRFQAARNAGEATLSLRQENVKGVWKVLLNGTELGRLALDENDQLLLLEVPAGRVVDGENLLRIEGVDRAPDDIRVGEIALERRPRREILSEAAVRVRVADADRPGEPLPCRITVVDARGALVPLGASSSDRLAVRTGVIYTAEGTAEFGLRGGSYRIHAGRGFEYGVDSTTVAVRAGDSIRKELSIRREVPTAGYLSCDPHLHTLTHSGHGDATSVERVLALAGEGIELAVATEHNLQVDYGEAAMQAGVRRFLTTVTGNEVTTSAGHFNIFPVSAAGPLPDHESKSWEALAASIAAKTGAPVVILNHPRDVHLGFRPFGPEHQQSVTGENLDGWKLFANGLEVVNSGAQQTDVLLPYRDWFALLNQGTVLTPVGASDSHDVSRFIAGQGRTYIRERDGDPGAIDVPAAVKSFLQGRVLVSCGLLAEIAAGGAGPGNLVSPAGEVRVEVRVLGPGWVTAEKVELFSNGLRIREALIPSGGRPGVKWSGEWILPPPVHDAFLVAIASGPGVEAPYWPIARPYQPAGPVPSRRVIGSTGALWIDGDGDGRWTCARDQARRLLALTGRDPARIAAALAGYDEAVAAQAAGLLAAEGLPVGEAQFGDVFRKAGGAVERGFGAFLAGWRESRAAREKLGLSP